MIEGSSCMQEIIRTLKKKVNTFSEILGIEDFGEQESEKTFWFLV